MISQDLLAQYTALTTSVGVAELTGRTLIEVTGADRVQLLHGFTTADVKKLPLGETCEAFITSPQGKTLGHVWITKLAESLLIDTVADQANVLMAHFDKYIISEDATLRDIASDQSELLVAGPRAGDLLQRARIDSAIVKRVFLLAAPSFVLQLHRDAIPSVRNTIIEAGAVECGASAVEMARVEAGTPLFGIDINSDNLPQEIARDTLAISFTKGCYLGQETVARIDALGHVNRRLTGVRLAGNTIPTVGTKLFAASQEVGQVTSAVWSPKIEAPLAMALLRRAQTKPGTALASEVGDAFVVALPV